MTNPLTKEDKTKITQALAAIDEVKKEINKAKLANIDVSAQEDRLKEIETRLLGVKRVYFPS